MYIHTIRDEGPRGECGRMDGQLTSPEQNKRINKRIDEGKDNLTVTNACVDFFYSCFSPYIPN